MMPKPAWVFLLLASLSACGPSKASGYEGGANGSESPSDDAEAGPDLDDDGDEDTTESGGDPTTTGSGFVPDSDAHGDPCDMFEQDCPEGEKCVPDFSGGTFRCVPVEGDKGVGESCVHEGQELGTDDCDGDSHCWNAVVIDGVPTGTCVPFCVGSPDRGGDCGSEPGCVGYDCKILGQTGYPICVPRCDPLAQDCPAGQGCNLDFDGRFGCWVLYEPVAIGQPCEWSNACEPGSMCVDGSLVPGCESPGCCAPLCDLTGDGSACDALPGSACADVLDVVDVGCGDVGLCVQ